MWKFRISIAKLLIFHFLMSLLIVLLAGEGFSHRSSVAVGILQLPLLVWPVWLFFLGTGWKRVISSSVALALLVILAVGFLTKDESMVERRRFVTSLGQIYITQYFDFDQSKELPDQIELEKPLPFGFVKTEKSFRPMGSSIGSIYETKTSEDSFEIKGRLGSYIFKHDGNELRLVY